MGGVDVNVKNLEAEVLERLAEQAAAEGMSQQEWIRQALRRTAARMSPAELMAARAQQQPMTEREFEQLRAKAAARREAALERLGAPRRR
jgi:ribbon-helix-helix CopG family protein